MCVNCLVAHKGIIVMGHTLNLYVTLNVYPEKCFTLLSLAHRQQTHLYVRQVDFSVSDFNKKCIGINDNFVSLPQA